MKRKILKASVYLAVIVNMFSVCCMDSTGWAFGAVMAAWVLSGAWLFLMAWANGWIGTADGKWFR